jgi:hypothetical protein
VDIAFEVKAADARARAPGRDWRGLAAIVAPLTPPAIGARSPSSAPSKPGSSRSASLISSSRSPRGAANPTPKLMKWLRGIAARLRGQS